METKAGRHIHRNDDQINCLLLFYRIMDVVTGNWIRDIPFIKQGMGGRVPVRINSKYLVIICGEKVKSWRVTYAHFLEIYDLDAIKSQGNDDILLATVKVIWCYLWSDATPKTILCKASRNWLLQFLNGRNRNCFHRETTQRRSLARFRFHSPIRRVM